GGVLLRAVLGDGLACFLEVALVVLAHRADVLAVAAAVDGAGTPQDALPEIEGALRADLLLLPAGVGLVDDVDEVLGELAEAVGVPEAIAAFPVAIPVADNVARATPEAASARRAEA